MGTPAFFDQGTFDSTQFDVTSINYTKSAADSLTLADSIVKKAKSRISEALTLVDALRNKVIKQLGTDTLTLVDSVVPRALIQFVEVISLSDGIVKAIGSLLEDSTTAVDLLAIKADLAAFQEALILSDATYSKAEPKPEDTAGTTDDITLQAAYYRTLTDTITLVDEITYFRTLGVNVPTPAKFDMGSFDESLWNGYAGDPVDVLDNLEIKTGFGVLIEDLLTLGDTLRASVNMSMDEVATVIEGLTTSIWGMDFTVTDQDLIAIADELLSAVANVLKSQVTLADAYQQAKIEKVEGTPAIFDTGVFGMTAFDDLSNPPISLADYMAAKVGLNPAEAVALVELLSMQAGKPLDEMTGVSDSIIAALIFQRSYDDLLGTLDAASWVFKKVTDEWLATSDAWYVDVQKAIAEAVNIAESLGLTTGKSLPDDGVGVIDELYLRYALEIIDDQLFLGEDTIRGKVKTLLQQVFIEGVSVPVTGLSVRDSGNDRISSCSFRIPSPSIEVLALAKQRAVVNVYLVDGEGNTDYFSGRIVGNPTRARSTITTEMEITVDDWTVAAQDVFVNEVYTSADGTLDQILKNMWTKYYGYEIDLTQVVATDKTIDLLPLPYETLFDATERLAQLLGWVWYVEWNGAGRILRFFPPSAAVLPVTLSRENRNIVAGSPRFGQNDRIANSVYVFGGEGVSNPFTEKSVADGQSTIYKFGAKPYRISEGTDGGITVNLIKPDNTVVPQTVGILNIHDATAYDVLVDFNDATLRWGDNNKPAKDYIIERTFKYTYPIMVHLTDDTSINQFGKIERTINDNNLKDIKAARDVGRAYLRDFAYPKGFGSCEVFVPGLRAGQFITVDLPAYNASGLYEITEIEKWIQGSVVRRRITLNVADDAESRIAQRLKEFAKRLASLEAGQRSEDLVIQRILQGPANVKVSATGIARGSIFDDQASETETNDKAVITWKFADGAKTYLSDQAKPEESLSKKAKLPKDDTVASSDKINGGITFFDRHTFDDPLHPIGI